MKTRKAVFNVMSLFLAVLLMVLMLSACAGNNGQTTQAATEKPTETSAKATVPETTAKETVPETTVKETVPETTVKETEPKASAEETKPSETQGQSGASSEPAGEPQTLTLIPVEDAMANINKESETSATAPDMGLVGSAGNEKFGFFKFEVSGVKGEVDKAIFRIYCSRTKDGVTGNTEVWSVDNSWSEKTLSWATMPEKKEKIGEFKTPSDGEWAEVDLANYIKGDGTYSFVLIPKGEGRGFLATKDTDKGEELRPQLVITTK